jgi:uncharacterized protein (TIGR00369 family)
LCIQPSHEVTVPPLSNSEKTRIVRQMSRFIPHAGLQGIRLESIEGDVITMRMPYRDELVGNPDTGAIHGGALMVLLDHTLGIAGICCDQVGAQITPTLDLRIDHLGVAPAGRDILATARVYKVTRRVLFVEGFAYCESRDKPIAKATGSWVLMPELDLTRLLQQGDAGAQQQ